MVLKLILVGLNLMTNLLFRGKDDKNLVSDVVPINMNGEDSSLEIKEQKKKHIAIRISEFLNHQYDFHICVGFLVSIQIDVFLALAIVVKLMVKESLLSLVSILFGITFLMVYFSIFIIFGYITFKVIRQKQKIDEKQLTGRKAWLTSFTKFYEDLAESGRL